MNIKIRKINKKDILKILELMVEFERYNLEELKLFEGMKVPTKSFYLSGLKKDMKSSKTIILVAEMNKKIVGYAIGKTYIDKYEKTKLGKAEELYIEPNLRKKGVGKMLDESRELELKKMGAKGIIAEVFKENEGSIKMHLKRGYEIISTEVTMFKKL